MKQILLTIILVFSLFGYASLKLEFASNTSEDILFNSSHSFNRMTKTELRARISVAKEHRETQIKRNKQWFLIVLFLISGFVIIVFTLRRRLNLKQTYLSNKFREAELIVANKKKREINYNILRNDLTIVFQKNLEFLASKIKGVSNQIDFSESSMKQTISSISELLEITFLNFGNTMFFLDTSTVSIQEIVNKLHVLIQKYEEFKSESSIILKVKREVGHLKMLDSNIGFKLLCVLEEGIKLGLNNNESSVISISIDQETGYMSVIITISGLNIDSFNTNLENKIYKIKKWTREINPEGVVHFNDNSEIEINLKVYDSQMQKSLSFDFHY